MRFREKPPILVPMSEDATGLGRLRLGKTTAAQRVRVVWRGRGGVGLVGRVAHLPSGYPRLGPCP